MLLTSVTALALTFLLLLDGSAAAIFCCCQDRSCRSPIQNEAYLSLAIRLSDKGSSEIIRANVVSGKLVQRNVPATDYLYEVARGQEILAVGFLPKDPFITRAFATLGAGEKVGPAKSVTIVLNVPSFEKSAGCDLEIRFYKIKLDDRIQEIDAGVFRRLKEQQHLSLEFEIAPEKLHAAICKK
jgi:hypothetical protein